MCAIPGRNLEAVRPFLVKLWDDAVDDSFQRIIDSSPQQPRDYILKTSDEAQEMQFVSLNMFLPHSI